MAMTETERKALEAAGQAASRELTEDDVAGQMSDRGRAWQEWKASRGN